MVKLDARSLRDTLSLEERLKIVERELREAEKDVLRRPAPPPPPPPAVAVVHTKPDRVGHRKLRAPIVLKARGAGV